jgi:activator of 2-hydroxyglutaryl-CoA dehydratase
LRQADYIDEETPGCVEIGGDDSRVIQLHGWAG